MLFGCGEGAVFEPWQPWVSRLAGGQEEKVTAILFECGEGAVFEPWQPWVSRIAGGQEEKDS